VRLIRNRATMQAQSHILLFNDERYQQKNLRPGQRLFRYDHVVVGRVVGTFSGVIDGELLDCGHSAPFGGIDFKHQGVFLGTIVDLLRAASERARGDGVRGILVRARPGYFGSNEVGVAFALLNLGARIESCEISLGLELRRYRRPDDYEATLKSTARSALRQGLEAGPSFGPAENASDWAACYEILSEARRRRGVQIIISFDYLMALREVFGKRIAMYRLMQGAELAAAALVYRVTRDWDYLVAWGDDIRYRPNRVMNVMAYQLVRAAIIERVGLIDLGISSVHGIPDDGLIQFKRNIGGVTGLRINFRLPLA
jgi:hypothetical protein